MRKKLFPISAIVATLCLTSMFAIWASAESSGTLNLDITATGGSFGRGKGICLQASTGTIVATLPLTYKYSPEPKTIGGVTSMFSFSYDENLPSPLTLDQDVMVHIHVDVPLRRLNDGESAKIVLLEIMGCTSVVNGVQYCIQAFHAIPSSDVGKIGTVTKTGTSTWEVDASMTAASEQGGAPNLCVNKWEQGNVVDGFCIPLYGLDVVCVGTITK